MDGTHRLDQLKRVCLASLHKALVAILASWALPATQAHAQYTEKLEAWSATSADIWQTKSLSGAPFSVPANAVVEVAVRNVKTDTERYGGVRAVGSGLERRFLLTEAEGNGYDFVVMHVQADASSQIQHYSDVTADVDFVLLGYWESGTYVERFDTFTAGADATWSDVNLSTYGVGASQVAEIVMSNKSATLERQAGVRTNGSGLARLVNLTEAQDGGVDVGTLLVKADSTASATIEVYAQVNADVDLTHVGYWSTPPGVYTELFTTIGSPVDPLSWEAADLSSSGVTNGDVAEFAPANEFATDEDMMGIRTSGSSLSRLLDLREAQDGGGDYGHLHVLASNTSEIEFYHEDVTDTHSFNLVGYWKTPLSDHDADQETDAFTGKGSETNAELFSFNLTPLTSFTITQVVFRLTGIVGLTDGDWAGIELLVDSNNDGNIGGGETTAVGGTGSVNQAAGTITFSTSFVVSASTNYILRADFTSLSQGDKVTIGLAKADLSSAATITGTTSSVTHWENCYAEKLQAWSATSADTWQTKSLSASPFSVPANAVVEVALRNFNGTAELYGGVRAVGSSLDRRFLLTEAKDNGAEIVVMHVQADSSSQIQHYSDVTADVDFVLLGYWTCGTYVERFDSFTAGASATWTDRNLCAYNVGPGFAAELVMSNGDLLLGRMAGVRTNGSALARFIDIEKAKDGGVSSATLFVRADATILATVELYAEDDADVTFYLVGYWSAAPLAYTELFADVGSPTADVVWQDKDLTASGLPDSAIAEFALENIKNDKARRMGVRSNGSTVSRLLDISDGDDTARGVARMHVVSDSTATIEFYAEKRTEGTFRLTGYWANCDTSIKYSVADLGAITAANKSQGYHINATRKFAGFEEDAGGAPDAWYHDCGTFTALGTLGGADAEAHGINNNNMVVGWAHTGAAVRRGYTWTSGGGMVDRGTVGGRTDSGFLSVNNNSEAVGTVVDFGPPPKNRLAYVYLPVAAYTLSSGLSTLGTLGGAESVGMDINDTGQVTGGAQEFGSAYAPFRWQNGTMTSLGTLGGKATTPDHRGEAINSSGDVAGRSYTSTNAARAFFWNATTSTMTDLGVLTDGTQSWAFGVNDSDVVVGTSDTTSGVFRAFIWDSTNGLRNLNNLISGSSGWTLLRATDINNDGFITGWGTFGGNTRAFLLTPTCSGGGGAAQANSLAGGEGTTSSGGEFLETIVDVQGITLGSVELVADQAGVEVEYEVLETDPVPEDGQPVGFENGVVLPRTLEVVTTTDRQEAFLAISMRFGMEEIRELDVAPSDLEVHVLDLAAGDRSELWVPAGQNIGESAPTDEVGQSGFYLHPDGTVEYWAVLDHAGTFAVGQPSSGVGAPQPTPVPFACGLGLIEAFLSCCTLLLMGRSLTRRGQFLGAHT